MEKNFDPTKRIRAYIQPRTQGPFFSRGDPGNDVGLHLVNLDYSVPGLVVADEKKKGKSCIPGRDLNLEHPLMAQAVDFFACLLLPLDRKFAFVKTSKSFKFHFGVFIVVFCRCF